ncbi:unnamed protein product [Meganyctiphanes norvegica]|uniref:Uncharacterized protein n=1 Tax=Meganyctiphanes norvegica TaxID=48144 RepID=A0AAV2Q149_MEGNR
MVAAFTSTVVLLASLSGLSLLRSSQSKSVQKYTISTMKVYGTSSSKNLIEKQSKTMTNYFDKVYNNTKRNKMFENKIKKQERVNSKAKLTKICRRTWHQVDIKQYISSHSNFPNNSTLKNLVDSNKPITPQVLHIKKCGNCGFKCTDVKGRKTGTCKSVVEDEREKTFVFYHCQGGKSDCPEKIYEKISLKEHKTCKCDTG